MCTEGIVEIVNMAETDLEEILAIEAVSFPSPWTRNMFLEELVAPVSQNIVARLEGMVAGYLDFWTFKDEVHILHIAVRPDVRRKGIASLLMEEMIRRACGRRTFSITLEVRRSNDGAIGLYERFGFKVRGIRPHYYTDTWEDALIMWADTEPKDTNYERTPVVPAGEDCP